MSLAFKSSVLRQAKQTVRHIHSSIFKSKGNGNYNKEKTILSTEMKDGGIV